MDAKPSNSKCCFCINLRDGVIVIAVVHIFGALGVLYPIGAGILFWGYIIELIVGLMAGATLLYGAIKYNTTAIVIHIVLAVIEIINVLAVAVLLLIFAFGFGEPPLAAHIFLFSLVAAVIILIYFIVCVYKFYQEIKSGKHDSSLNHMAEII